VRLGTIFAIVLALSAYVRAGSIECQNEPENERITCLFLGPKPR
jgi:hypothetical protein